MSKYSKFNKANLIAGITVRDEMLFDASKKKIEMQKRIDELEAEVKRLQFAGHAINIILDDSDTQNPRRSLPYFLPDREVGIDRDNRGYIVIYGNKDQYALTPQRYETFELAEASILAEL